MKIKIILLIAILSNPLFAGKDIKIVDTKVIEIPTIDESAFYLGVGASYINLQDSTTDESFTSLGAMLQLGYRYNSYIALEARYTQSVGDVQYDKGNTAFANNSNYPTTSSNISLYLKPQYPIGDLKLYGLIGYGATTYTDLPTATPSDRTERGFQWGAGTEYLVMENISIFADYTRVYDGVGLDGHVPNSDVYSDIVTVGVSYSF